jgi:hypothetical protein
MADKKRKPAVPSQGKAGKPGKPQPPDDFLKEVTEEVAEEELEEEAIEAGGDEIAQDVHEDVIEEDAITEEFDEKSRDEEEAIEEADEEVVEEAEEEVIEEAEEEVIEQETGDVAFETSEGEDDSNASFAGLTPDLSYAGINVNEGEETLQTDAEDAVEAEEDEEAEDEEDVYAGPPRPKLTIFNLVLILLNVAAVGAFLYFLVEDYAVRQAWSYAILKTDLRYFGLPTEEEEHGPVTARINLPRVKLPPELLKQVHSERGGAGEAFPTTEFVYRPRIKPSELREQMLKDHFHRFEANNAVLSTPSTGLITTVEKEMAYLRSIAWNEMSKAAKEYVDALKEADKKPTAIALLFSLAPDLKRAEKTQKIVNAADPKQTADLCQEAVLRRMAFDVLAPIELYRPGDLASDFSDKIGDLDVPLAKIQQRLEQRIDSAAAKDFDPAMHLGKEWDGAKRNTFEKRHTSAFTMVALAQVRTPAPTRKLVFPNLLNRAQCVVGMFDFAAVVPEYLTQHRNVEEKWLQQIHLERKHFVEEYQALVNQIVNLLPEIDHQTFTNAFLAASNKQYQDMVKSRTDDMKQLIEKIIVARRESAKTMKELEEMQTQLFEAQVRLATAEQENNYLETVIARAQRALKGVKKQ